MSFEHAGRSAIQSNSFAPCESGPLRLFGAGERDARFQSERRPAIRFRCTASRCMSAIGALMNCDGCRAGHRPPVDGRRHHKGGDLGKEKKLILTPEQSMNQKQHVSGFECAQIRDGPSDAIRGDNADGWTGGIYPIPARGRRHSRQSLLAMAASDQAGADQPFRPGFNYP